MQLTVEQQNAILPRDSHVTVIACPGSGKTRTLIAKLLQCVDQVRNSTRRIACITYTNTAVHEIEARLRQLGSSQDEDYYEVSTIHSFCQLNVLRQFYWLVPECAKGYRVLPPDSEEFKEVVKELAHEYRLNSYMQDQFEKVNRLPNGAPTSEELDASLVYEFWQRLFRKGCIDYCNIVYFSYRILRDTPWITQAVAHRFAHILVDEFQDTTELQSEILAMIQSHNQTRLFLVGDPEQSIFSFAGASPDSMVTFSARVNSHETSLLGNFRSSTQVITCAEKVRPRIPPMYAAGDDADCELEPSYVSKPTTFMALTDYFLPVLEEMKIGFGETAIIAPQWNDLRSVAGELRDYSVPVIGPGARPYRRAELFALLAEQVCAFIEAPRPEFVRQAERELFQIVLTVTGKADFTIFTYFGRRVVFRIIAEARRIHRANDSGANWLREASRATAAILAAEGVLPVELANMLSESAENMLREMKTKIDLSQLTIDALGMFADPSKCMKLTTIHKAKGREFDAVAFIGLHERAIPYYSKKATDAPPKGIAEGRRLFYVGVTRAKRMLLLVTEAGKTKSRYLKEIGF